MTLSLPCISYVFTFIKTNRGKNATSHEVLADGMGRPEITDSYPVFLFFNECGTDVTGYQQ